MRVKTQGIGEEEEFQRTKRNLARYFMQKAVKEDLKHIRGIIKNEEKFDCLI
jgi:hypothetical protein